MKLEIRWFFEGEIPEEVIEWREGKKFILDETKDGKDRIDSYLCLPEPHSDVLGIKSREGKFEIKYRDSSFNFKNTETKLEGVAEYWSKSSSRLENKNDDIFKGLKLQTMGILKIRYGAKYKTNLDDFSFKQVEWKDIVDNGIALEITFLEIRSTTNKSKKWWTIGFEIFGEKVEEALSASTTKLLSNFPMDFEKDFTLSLSYPQWITYLTDKE